MKTKRPEKILVNYTNVAAVRSCKPFGKGHINDTYLVETSSQKFILQRVNKKVFLTSKLVSNYELLVPAVEEFQLKFGVKITPDIYKTKNGTHHCFDNENNAWRLVEFIPEADSYDISPDPDISYMAAKAMGNYQVFLNSIDPQKPCDTIKGFHNLPSRMEVFNQTLNNCDNSLLRAAEKEIQRTKDLYYIEKESSKVIPQLPLRVTHNDTKLNNILFKDGSCMIIDLDTVMKGFVMFDYGDMVRTFTSPALEDERDLAATQFRIDHFEALTRGYLESLINELTDVEKETLLFGAFYIIYEQVLRFLTDFLKGNVYYKVAFPEHNLLRTRTQLKLLESIVTHKTELNSIISRYL